jgi:hypothetical protein
MRWIGSVWTLLPLTWLLCGCCNRPHRSTANKDPVSISAAGPQRTSTKPNELGANNRGPSLLPGPRAQYIGPGNVPDVPTSRSSPPTVAEWESAAEVNTVGPNSAPSGCFMRVMREWLKVNCEGNIRSVDKMDGFKNPGDDYFEYVIPGKVADLVMRMKQGQSLRARIYRDKDKAGLFMNWPGGSSKPSIIALQTAPP